jgi:hypothetical protein
MKKFALAIAMVAVIAFFASSRWSTRAVDAPADNTVQAGETTLAAALSLDNMIDQSDVIAIGNCVDSRSVWVDRALVTLATISVSESLKGDQSSTITVALPGGVDMNRKFPVAMSYPGAPRIIPGENVLLFLTNTGEVGGSYNVAGFSQGKFSIITGEDGVPMVSRDLTKMSLQDNNGVGRGGRNMLPLSTLKDEIKGRLQKQ